MNITRTSSQLLSVLIFATTLFGSAAFAADNKATEMKKNAWETICDQGVAAACSKAGSLLEEKLVSASDVKEEGAIRARLLHVSRIGCENNALASCSLLFENSEKSGDKDSLFAKEVSARKCTDGDKSACAQVSRFEEEKAAAFDLNDTEAKVEFDSEFLTASK